MVMSDKFSREISATALAGTPKLLRATSSHVALAPGPPMLVNNSLYVRGAVVK